MGLPIHKVVAGQTYEYPIKFYIPALVPNLNVFGCLEVDYEACLDVGLVRSSPKSAFLTLNVNNFVGVRKFV